MNNIPPIDAPTGITAFDYMEKKYYNILVTQDFIVYDADDEWVRNRVEFISTFKRLFAADETENSGRRTMTRFFRSILYD